MERDHVRGSHMECHVKAPCARGSVRMSGGGAAVCLAAARERGGGSVIRARSGPGLWATTAPGDTLRLRSPNHA
jgi:hypothetical protein